MDVKALEELFADEVAVKHGGHTFTLRAPALADASKIVADFGQSVESLPEGSDARVQYLAALTRAVDLTLAVDDGAMPKGLAQRIVLGTGGLSSPVALAAARMCGLPLVGAEAVPDDLPT